MGNKRTMQVWHVGENTNGEETVLQASPFGEGLQEFRLQTDESVLVRDGNGTDLLVVACRQTIQPSEILTVLENLTKLVTDLMPGVAHIALPDYALLNDAPIAAQKMIRKLRAS